MRDEHRTHVLERLAAGDMVVMMVAVNDVADRRVRDLADLGEVDLAALLVDEADRVGRDHAFGRDDEHRLVAHHAEDVDVVRDFRRGERRRRGPLLREGAGNESERGQCGCEPAGRREVHEFLRH